MGLDTQSLQFLKFCAKNKNFGRTITIGRQSCHVNLSHLKRTGWKEDFVPDYIEDILVNCFKAEIGVDSIDNSNYEGATIIGDLNNDIAIPEKRYKTIIDLGSMEHIFNIPKVINNIQKLCEIGSQIIQVLPANGFCGHGLYQFSPEFFFALYSKENGYANTAVYVKKMDRSGRFYKVKKPESGIRRQFYSYRPAYVCVSTTVENIIKEQTLQQSDFEHQWSGNEKPQRMNFLSKKLKRYLLRNSSLWNDPFVGWMYQYYVLGRYSINRFNPNLELKYFQ